MRKRELEYKKCWKCGKQVIINDYGYGICEKRENHSGWTQAYNFTDQRHFKIIQSDGSEIWR